MSIIILSLLVFFVVVFVLKGVLIVQQAETVVIERLGKYHTILGSGINIIMPLFDRPREVQWRYVTEGNIVRRMKHQTSGGLR
jgi:regulator of protease activity HflC (stomatin/prohibitin superfamily)